LEKLTEKLASRVQGNAVRVPGQNASTSFLNVTAAYVSKFSLDLLHSEICSILPRIKNPGDCHRLLMSFPWRRIYTTNYDLFLEKSDEEGSIGIAYDEKLDDNRGKARKLVIKLCGDREHTSRMRATRERLKLSSLEDECPTICEDLLWHIGEAPFLFIGYSMNDEFLTFGRDVVTRQAKEKNIEVPTSFLLGCSVTPEENHRFSELGLVVIDLQTYGFGRDRKNAFIQFFRQVLDYCSQWDRRDSPFQQASQAKTIGRFWPRKQPAPQPEPTELEKSLYPWSDAAQLPIIVASTEGSESQRILKQYVRPVLLEGGYSELLLSVKKEILIGLREEGENTINRVLSKSFCAIFILDRSSERLERLVELALSRRCRAIILYNDDSNLGFITADLRHRDFSYPLLQEYIAEELFNANVEQRLSRSAELSREGDFAMCILQAWLVCEIAHVHARKKLSQETAETRLNNLRKPVELVRFLRESGYVVPEGLDVDIENTRRVRNRVAHEGYQPTQEKAEVALVMARRLVRLLHREDLPEFLSTLVMHGTVPGTRDPQDE